MWVGDNRGETFNPFKGFPHAESVDRGRLSHPPREGAKIQQRNLEKCPELTAAFVIMMQSAVTRKMKRNERINHYANQQPKHHPAPPRAPRGARANISGVP
jgi:hypothetical protein